MSQNLISIDRQIKRKYKPKLKTYIRIAKNYESSENLKHLLDELGRAEKQKEAVLYYFKLNALSKKPLSKKEFKEKADVSYAVIKALVDKEIFEEYSIQEDRIKKNKKAEIQDLTLSPEQTSAFESIENHFRN